MMTNLFSVFDPSTTMKLNLNWLSTLLGLFIIPMTYWLMSSRNQVMWKIVTMTLFNEFKMILSNKDSHKTILFISIFILILFNNTLGLIPFIFTSTSHLTMTLTLGLPLWFSFMLYGWINNTLHMFAHLVPQGTPNLLMPFMVCIETISNVIRPGTLAVRLTANMIAGHLLLTLLGNTGNYLTLTLLFLMIIAQTALMMLESAVAIIQSYVFAILSTLYSSEVN
nr:ATP synthase F0 subunit 6 [Systropus sp. 2 YXA-2022a]